MKKFNLVSIMKEAWKIFRTGKYSFGTSLKIAWSNAKLHNLIKEHEGVEEETHSWAGWKTLGYEVKHGSTALYSVMVAAPETKTGYRKKSFFGASQVHAIA